MRYCYSLIRFVPDPAKGEFVNVGVIAGSDESSEWAVRQVANPIRARHLDERRTLPAVWSFIDELGRQVDAYEAVIEGMTLETLGPRPSEEWLSQLHTRYTNIVQLSPPLPMVADSLEDTLETLFAELIVDPEKRPGGATKHPALAAIRQAYKHAGLLPGRVVEGATLEAEGHRERLDFGVANGRIVQITQAWSFQVADQESLAKYVRAWGWAVKAAQDSGGALRTAEREVIEVPRDVDVEVVYIPPEGTGDGSALVDARSVFHALHAREVLVRDVDAVASRAVELLD